MKKYLILHYFWHEQNSAENKLTETVYTVFTKANSFSEAESNIILDCSKRGLKCVIIQISLIS